MRPALAFCQRALRAAATGWPTQLLAVDDHGRSLLLDPRRWCADFAARPRPGDEQQDAGDGVGATDHDPSADGVD